ncbi:B-4DMT family transporter [Rhodococcus sp. BP-252]|uniref:Transmembrane protein n=1 Tax=Rhodococcoides kyotonense TaxID=398843 RepID=A0A177YG73_9NOCA|nr:MULTISPECIES: B-4DMT family transporter [Rhodococcus]MBY6409949.1 B-4DMT family transporter [Rhodococcus sp. BP-320]MBY6414917.1 B-4DMT family transporter [Rhodococcus sp. BP-321]MBY6421379.1 B-4DMT family transporter [Rhodococcus sp. BP-324]MBY6425775.1 B-4DMT family transporter [Rhodococcus sp. BP-323]MBY6429813.1 B-4DMT family transporter [Rhodococcus sp. BP-322]
MTGWVVRGIGMGLINVGVRILLGAAVAQWPTHGSQLRWVGMAAVLLAVVVWAGIDGIRDRHANPDPEYGKDLTMVWLKAAVVGGLLAGLLAWLVGFLVEFSVGQNSLFFELTSGAAFTILVIFIPATIAVFLGRLLASRDAKKKLAATDAEREQHRREHHTVGANASGQSATGQAAPSQSTADQARWADDSADTEVFPAVGPDLQKDQGSKKSTS